MARLEGNGEPGIATWTYMPVLPGVHWLSLNLANRGVRRRPLKANFTDDGEARVSAGHSSVIKSLGQAHSRAHLLSSWAYRGSIAMGREPAPRADLPTLMRSHLGLG
jgi:hypothetical protein